MRGSARAYTPQQKGAFRVRQANSCNRQRRYTQPAQQPAQRSRAQRTCDSSAPSQVTMGAPLVAGGSAAAAAAAALVDAPASPEHSSKLRINPCEALSGAMQPVRLGVSPGPSTAHVPASPTPVRTSQPAAGASKGHSLGLGRGRVVLIPAHQVAQHLRSQDGRQRSGAGEACAADCHTP